MKTKIINYESGSKGDFIINFLNDCVGFDNLGQSMASAGADTRVFGQSLPYKDLDRYVDLLLDSNYNEKFISSHSLIYMSDAMLEKLSKKYDLFHIYVDSEWQKQVNIDMIFKVFIKPIHESLLQKASLENTNQKTLEYNIDFQMPNTLIINNEHRIKFVNFYVNTNKFNHRKTTFIQQLNYKDLFVTPYKDTRKLYSNIFDEKKYTQVLSKSFLPKTIDAFGHTFNIEELGYRYYI